MEGDVNNYVFRFENGNFNPLPPYGGRRQFTAVLLNGKYFNPLPPYGGRRGFVTQHTVHIFISIHSLRMEGDRRIETLSAFVGISIHSLRMEGDSTLRQMKSLRNVFQSTPSVWRETCLPVAIRILVQISIHSLRMEGDQDNCY